MTAAEWSRIKELFDATRLLPAAERGSFLEAQHETPGIVDEVRSLLSVYEESPGFLEGAVAQLPAKGADNVFASFAERRIGPWRLVREIGRGGMGVVWEAQRDDGQYEQRVAIKLLPASLLSGSDIARFREERQILARLDHPNITRLLDGGTLGDGSPYLVMEYVEGAALEFWCDSQGLDLRDRLRLFLPVCAAVEYAHRHLVIHRDLKPANILITPEGTPKLLDFGIAKLIEPGAPATGGRTRMLTPEYASPEQLRGEAVTTASDVFSLGVLLYVLLTGRKPYAPEGGDVLEVVRAICQDEPLLPSAAAGRRGGELRDELDAIILQALRKDPNERYASARALGDDIRAWLDGRAVTAHGMPRWRRAARFICRKKVQSAAAAAVLLSILAGSGVSLWYAHDAHRERALAEARFNQVRRLADSLVFELHDSIQSLPGSTGARKLLVQRAIEYLRELEATGATSDRDLQLDLASAYLRIGDVQGYRHKANLGDTVGAEESYTRARRIAQEILQRHPEDEQAETTLASADSRLGGMRWLHGDPQARFDLGREAANIRFRQAKRHANSPALLAGAYFTVAETELMARDWKPALADWQQAIAAYDRAVAREPGRDAYRLNLGLSHHELGSVYSELGEFAAARQEYEQAERIHSALLQSKPEDVSLRVWLAEDFTGLAWVLNTAGHPREALAYCRRAIEELRRLISADPNDAGALTQLGIALLDAATAYEKLGQDDRAVEFARRACADFDSVLHRDPRQGEAFVHYRNALTDLGDFLARRAASAARPAALARADWTEAATSYDRAAQLSSRLLQWWVWEGATPLPAAELSRRAAECRKHLLAPKR